MAIWCVLIRQLNKGTNMQLNEFTFTVEADHKADAKVAALAQMQAQSEGLQTIHVQDGPFANAQRRPYRHLGWQGSRNIIVSIKRVSG